MTTTSLRSRSLPAAERAPRPSRAGLRRIPIEWPTWLLAFAIHGGFVAVVVWNAALGPVVSFAALALLVAWHSSLVHECVHGHPSRIAWLNAVVAGAPLTPHMPFARYREIHLRHHAAGHLTEPGTDTESFYVGAEGWRAMPAPLRWLHTLNMTLAGRMVVGPAMDAIPYLAGEVRALVHGDKRVAATWAVQGVLLVGLFAFLDAYAVSWWQYLVFAVYPGLGLMKVRSYLEHRPGAIQAERTAIVEAGWFWSLLFLNNNLHVVHHDRPRLPWYAIPAVYWNNRERVRRRNGGYVYSGYAEVFRRYFLTPRDTPAHPGATASSAAV